MSGFDDIWAEAGDHLVTFVRANYPSAPESDVEAVCRDLYAHGIERPADMLEALLALSTARQGQVPALELDHH
jgi:hypothetical protein